MDTRASSVGCRSCSGTGAPPAIRTVARQHDRLPAGACWRSRLPISTRPRPRDGTPAPIKLPCCGLGGYGATSWGGSNAGGWSSTRMSTVKATSADQEAQDEEARLGDTLRAVPLVAGAMGITGTLANRLLSGIAPVVDASSSQSRADVLVIVLSAVLLLTGLQWLSLKPRQPVPVELIGDSAQYLEDGLPDELVQELQWAYGALSSAAPARALVVVLRGRCLCHIGASKSRFTPGGPLEAGPICSKVMQSGKGNYLANLVLFPGRSEFLSYLPTNTQGVIVQPLGEEGYMVVATDTQRGFGTIDQAWISAVAEKLTVSLEAVA